MTEPVDQPVVSVIIPVYNGERYLAETVQSVIDQTMTAWEIIAVNDGSSDRSLEILEAFREREPGRVRVITVKNGGVSRARNTGSALARGRYIAFLDQDDLWAPDKLRLQTALISGCNHPLITFTNETLIDEQGTIIRENVLTLKESCRGDIFASLLFDNFIPISSVMLEKELFIKAGGFDPSYALAEDFDLLLRVAKEIPAEYIDSPLLKYREHKESGTYTKIDRITSEAMEIIRHWRVREPALFRKHYLKYLRFRLTFRLLKCKIYLKKRCCSGRQP
jgi:glycosyltransferase involved in cell wall biosynthesis